MSPTADPAPDTVQFRVQELADHAGVSVDTIRFYQKRHLLAPPVRTGRVAWYGTDHLDRLHQIRDLQAEGFTLAIIRRVLDGELDPVDRPLAAAVAESDTEEFLTVDELASRAGVPTAVIEAVVAEGLMLPRVHDGVAHFTTADVDVAAAGLELLQAGVPLPALLELARRHHAATIEIATAAVEMFDEHVRHPLLDARIDDDERAARLVAAFRTLLPATGTLVAQHFRRVLLRVAQEHLEAVGDDDEIAAADAAATRRIEEARR